MKYSCHQKSSVISGWFVYWVYEGPTENRLGELGSLYKYYYHYYYYYYYVFGWENALLLYFGTFLFLAYSKHWSSRVKGSDSGEQIKLFAGKRRGEIIGDHLLF